MAVMQIGDVGMAVDQLVVSMRVAVSLVEVAVAMVVVHVFVMVVVHVFVVVSELIMTMLVFVV